MKSYIFNYAKIKISTLIVPYNTHIKGMIFIQVLAIIVMNFAAFFYNKKKMF